MSSRLSLRENLCVGINKTSVRWRLPDRRLLRFGLVGILNTGLSYAAYALLLSFGLNYAAANLGALIIGIITGFRLQGVLVFRNRSWRPLFRFVVMWMLLYVINVMSIRLLLGLGASTYLAGAVMLLPMVAVSYLVQKFLVFR